MKKGELKTRLLEITSDKLDFDLEEIEADEPCQTLEDVIGVQYASEGWNEYVIGLLNADEMSDGYPRIHGLRRLVSLLLGDIISSKATQVFISHSETRSITINYEVQISWKLDTPIGFGNLSFNPQARTFGGVADCVEDNSNAFGKHPGATAESKAEGRALRKALALNVISADERQLGTEDTPALSKTATITKPLLSVIRAKLSKLTKVISEADAIKEFGLDIALEKFNVQEARDFFEHLGKYTQGSRG